MLSKVLVLKKEPVYVLDESSPVKAYKRVYQSVDGQLVDAEIVDKNQIQISEVPEIPEKKSKASEEDVTKGNYRRTWNCTQCPFSTMYGYSLRTHILNQHSHRKEPKKAKEERPIYECEMCGKKYTLLKFLRGHIKSFCNKAYDDFKCEHCPFTTRKKYPSLYNHMKKHSEIGDKKNHMKKHSEIVYKKKQYKCSECNKSFKLKGLLNKHNKKCGDKDWD